MLPLLTDPAPAQFCSPSGCGDRCRRHVSSGDRGNPNDPDRVHPPDGIRWRPVWSAASTSRIRHRRNILFRGAWKQTGGNPDPTGTRHGDHRTARQSRFDERCGTTTLAQQHALPTVYYLREFAEGGGLVATGRVSPMPTGRPGSMQGEFSRGRSRPTCRSSCPPGSSWSSLKTANALGLAVPPTLLATAEEVIE